MVQCDKCGKDFKVGDIMYLTNKVMINKVDGDDYDFEELYIDGYMCEKCMNR